MYTKRIKDIAKSHTIDYNFSKANDEQLYRDIASANWESVSDSLTVYDPVDSFCNTLYAIFDKCIPRKRPKLKYPIWFSNYLIKLIEKKTYHRRKWKQTIGDVNYHHNKFKELPTLSKKETSAAYRTYLRNCETDILTEPKSFWTFIKNKRRKSECNALNYEGQQLSEETAIADAFTKHF